MPLALVVCVRLSLVCSFTRLTVVLGRMPPEASVTVPVMPPRVCCAGAGKERTNWKQQQRKEEKKTDNVVFLLLIIRNGLLNSSRYTWPIKASQDSLGTAICKSEAPGLAMPPGQNAKCCRELIPILLGVAMKFLICADLFFTSCGKRS